MVRRLLSLAQRELRRQAAIRGWDQRALARAAGLSEATVSRLMSGHRIRTLTALQLVQALRRQPVIPELAELLGEEDGLGSV